MKLSIWRYLFAPIPACWRLSALRWQMKRVERWTVCIYPSKQNLFPIIKVVPPSRRADAVAHAFRSSQTTNFQHLSFTETTDIKKRKENTSVHAWAKWNQKSTIREADWNQILYLFLHWVAIENLFPAKQSNHQRNWRNQHKMTGLKVFGQQIPTGAGRWGLPPPPSHQAVPSPARRQPPQPDSWYNRQAQVSAMVSSYSDH